MLKKMSTTRTRNIVKIAAAVEIAKKSPVAFIDLSGIHWGALDI